MIKVAVLISSSIDAPNGASAYVRRLFMYRHYFKDNGIELLGPYCGTAPSKDMSNYSNSIRCKLKQRIKNALSKTRYGTSKAISLAGFVHAKEAVDKYGEDLQEPDIILFNDTDVLKVFTEKFPYYGGKIISVEHGNGNFGQMLREAFPNVSEELIAEKLRLQCDASDRIVFVGEGNRRRFASQYVEMASKSRHIHLGIDPPPLSSMEEVEEELVLPSCRGELQLITTGTICYRKNQLEIIRAVACKELRGRVSLIVLGNGPDYDAACKLVDDLDIGQYVVLPGMTQYVGNYLQEVDAYICASFSEGLPTAALEGMFYHLPLLMTYAGASEEIVDGNGYMIQGHDAEAISNAIGLLLESYSSVERLGDVSYDLFSRLHTGKKMCEEYKALFYEVANEDVAKGQNEL